MDKLPHSEIFWKWIVANIDKIIYSIVLGWIISVCIKEIPLIILILICYSFIVFMTNMVHKINKIIENLKERINGKNDDDYPNRLSLYQIEERIKFYASEDEYRKQLEILIKNKYKYTVFEDGVIFFDEELFEYESPNKYRINKKYYKIFKKYINN